MSLKAALFNVSKLDKVRMEKTFKSINETMKILKEFERASSHDFMFLFKIGRQYSFDPLSRGWLFEKISSNFYFINMCIIQHKIIAIDL